MKKKFLSILLAFSLVTTLSIPAFAAEPVTFDSLVENKALSTQAVTVLSQKFLEMSNDEFDQIVAELTTSSTNFEVLKANLEQCGVQLQYVEKDVHSPTLTRSLNDSDAEIVLSAARRNGEDYYHLVAGLNFSNYELYPSSKDGVTIFFDASAAEYIDYNEGNGFRLRSGQKATEGTLVFNFDDSLVNWLSYDDTFYGAVYARPYSSKSVVYGADYAHTYGDVDFNVTGGSIGFNFGPVVNGSVTVNFELVEKEEEMWQIGVVERF